MRRDVRRSVVTDETVRPSGQLPRLDACTRVTPRTRILHAIRLLLARHVKRHLGGKQDMAAQQTMRSSDLGLWCLAPKRGTCGVTTARTTVVSHRYSRMTAVARPSALAFRSA